MEVYQVTGCIMGVKINEYYLSEKNAKNRLAEIGKGASAFNESLHGTEDRFTVSKMGEGMGGGERLFDNEDCDTDYCLRILNTFLPVKDFNNGEST